jgi:O-antigen/teichoic acid export membrane protein
MGSQAAALLLVFFAQRIILTALSPAENGTLFLERRLTELFVGLLADFGMNGVVLRRAAQHPDKRIEIVSSAAWLRIGLWALTTLGVGAYVVVSNGPLSDVLMWSAFLLIASRTTLLRYTLEIQHRAASKFIMPSLVAFADAVLFFGLIWLFRDQCSPSAVIAIFLVSAVPGFLAIALVNGAAALHPGRASLREIKTIITESLPMLAYILIWGFQDKIDAAILEHYASRADVGVLGAAYTSLGPVISLLPQTLALVALPEISRLMSTDPSKAVGLASGLLRFTLLCTILLTVIAIALIPEFIQYVTGGRYSNSIEVFTLFVWTAPCIGVLVLIQESLVAMGRQRDTLWIACTMLVGTVLGGVLLVPGYHAMGSVVAKVAASVAGAIAALIVLRRASENMLEGGLILRSVVFTVGTVLVSYGMRVLSVPSAAYLVVMAAAVAGMAIVLRIVQVHELRSLWYQLRGSR